MNVAGLYSGIGGLELGFRKAGFDPGILCEIDPLCQQVLAKHFVEARLFGDVAQLRTLPNADVLTAGFPCTSFSQVGLTTGLSDGRWYIDQILRLLTATRRKPRFIVLENVPFIVHLDDGAAILKIVNAISKLGYSWAYRILDTHGFGLPQRRRRWIFLAARDQEASSILFGGDRRRIAEDVAPSPVAHGFYWTEGTRGIGWADDAIPPLKGGSGVGIPSAPAVWNRGTGAIFVPHIMDAERLQGFAANWTQLRGEDGDRMQRFRWRLLGNAVSVPMAEWIARRILTARYSVPNGDRLRRTEPLPSAAFGSGTMRFGVDAAERPSRHLTTPIIEFLREPGTPLSARATRGFRTRFEASPLRKNVDFVTALRRHERSVEATCKRASNRA